MTDELSRSDINAAMKLNCEARFDYFIEQVADTGDIWILVNDQDQFLKIYSEEDEFEYLPVWPHTALAVEYARTSEQALKPKSLTLAQFFSRWVPGLTTDGLEIGVFPTKDKIVWIMSPTELKADLQDEVARR